MDGGDGRIRVGQAAVHTTVVGPKGEHVEFQIRTEDMHRVAEYGIAAHWKYKEQGRVGERDSKAFGWLHQFVEWNQDLPDNRQFMDSVKLDLFHDVVYVFTPKGIVKELPKGSTPVDFAYAIHTEVGDHCVGAKVNAKIVPLKHQLASGDTVEILTSATQTPHKDWLKFVRTSRAKTKIKHWIKIEEQKRSIEIGRRLLESEFRRHGMAPAKMLRSDELLDAARESGFETVDELTAAVGFGRVATAQVIEKLKGTGNSLIDRYIELLEANVSEITSRFGNNISSRMFSLTQREIDICNMIKSGFSSKQISQALHVSTRTVETHRNSIRKKLDISGKKVNLATYLKFL